MKQGVGGLERPFVCASLVECGPLYLLSEDGITIMHSHVPLLCGIMSIKIIVFKVYSKLNYLLVAPSNCLQNNFFTLN